MFGARTSQVFTSRWKALFWSVGVLTTAYCTIPAADDDAATPKVNSAQARQASDREQQARELIRNLDSLGKN